LITGITGFVGSNLAKNLIENKANITGIGKSQKIESLLFYENLDKKCNLVFGNILDKDLIQNTIRKYNIEICFHLAAQIEVGSAKQYPFETWESNIRGTYNILEAIRTSEKNVKAIIIASSDKAYGEYGIKKMPYKENYELKAKVQFYEKEVFRYENLVNIKSEENEVLSSRMSKLMSEVDIMLSEESDANTLPIIADTVVQSDADSSTSAP
jgi:nucleoside-diphosphate-sugar epimerase